MIKAVGQKSHAIVPLIQDNSEKKTEFCVHKKLQLYTLLLEELIMIAAIIM
jgi:hypothetical protein